eukprot:5328336-Amphidinium_carterae.1
MHTDYQLSLTEASFTSYRAASMGTLKPLSCRVWSTASTSTHLTSLRFTQPADVSPVLPAAAVKDASLRLAAKLCTTAYAKLLRV